MKSTGYIINGIYYRDEPVMDMLTDDRAITDKQYNHDKQRQEHAFELMQPWKNGKLNPEFITHYPEEAKKYGENQSQ
jgi:hypothetical protein